MATRYRFAHVDVKYVLFAELYDHLRSPKAKRKAFALVEAAITCVAKRGFDGVTLDMIAREAGVSRPLLTYYFSDERELHEIMVKYIRLLFQKMAIEAMIRGTSPRMQLVKYVEACFTWADNFRAHGLVWLAFLHHCPRNPAFRKLNTLAAAVGADRISALIESAGSTVVSSQAAAKSIQAVITGALMVRASEDLEDLPHFNQKITDLCLQLAGM